MRWCGPCDLDEFSHPRYLYETRKLFSGDFARDARWPVGNEIRKDWEFTKTAIALEEFGALRPDSVLLNVAGGSDPLNYYFTNFVKWVITTDLYGEGVWARDGAQLDVLRDPGEYFLSDRQSTWNPRRLIAQHMDARALRYEDGVFDGVWSLSSIEHMDGLPGAIAAVREMARVTKPGAPIVLTTECVIADGGPFYAPDISLFSPAQLEEIVASVADVAGLVEPFSLENAHVDPTLVRDHAAEMDRQASGEGIATPAIYYSNARLWPGTGTFTSVMLVFRRRIGPRR